MLILAGYDNIVEFYGENVLLDFGQFVKDDDFSQNEFSKVHVREDS